MKRKINVLGWHKNALPYFVAVLTPMVIMAGVWAFEGIYPFGEKSLLTIDLNTQYVNFFSWFRSVFKNGGDIFYSFSKTLGGDMIGLTAYYLMSPFNLILLLFSTSRLPEAVEIITLLKIGCCGLTMYLLINSRHKSRMSLLFSNAYALMSYNMVYQQNIMWLDGVLLLPLVLLGIGRIIQKKSSLLYMAALVMAILTNYYIGYMICIFSVLYFLYESLTGNGAFKIRNWLGISARFSVASLFSGGLCAVLLLPVLKSLEGGKAVFSLSALNLSTCFHWSDFLLKLFPGSMDYEQIKYGLPNVFCGTIILLLAVFFFLGSTIQIKKKAGALLICITLFLSFYIDGLQLIWHGLNYPTWFPYRYSFVFCSFLILISGDGYEAVRKEKRRFFIPQCVIVMICILLLSLWAAGKKVSFLQAAPIVFSMVCAAAAIALLALSRSKLTVLPSILLITLGAMEMGVNGIWCLSVFNYVDYVTYRSFVEENEPIFESLKPSEQELYRMEKTYYRKESDPMLLSYYGLSHYSSTEKNSVKAFMEKMGLRMQGNWCNYNGGSTSAVDSFLGVRYILSKKKLENAYTYNSRSGDISIYENPYVLPVGFLTDEGVKTCLLEEADKFQLQNQLWKSLAPELPGSLFQRIEQTKIKTKNLTAKKEDNGIRYIKKNNKKAASLTYSFTARNTNPLYLYLPTDEMHQVKIYVNNKKISTYYNTYNYNILRLGSYKEGQPVKIQVRLDEDQVLINDVLVYEQNMQLLESYYEALRPGFLHMEKTSESALKGTVTVNGSKKTLLFTFPYDNSWHAYIDGERMPLVPAYGTLLTIDVPEGTHEIYLRYIPAGLKKGAILTLIFLILSAAFLWTEHKINHQTQQRKDIL